MKELTPAQFTEAANALARLQDLRSKVSPIVTKETASLAAEISALEQFLGSFLLVHAAELLASYACVKREYEPLIKIIATRCTQHTLHTLTVMGQQQPSPVSQAEAPDTQPANVINLPANP